MISGKKNYVEQLLHLALTLSLLRVDPENYLDLQWETRLAGTGVGGWQLELRAAPLTDQTYVNRKALPSIIEDLARFDTQYNVPTHFDLQAYLLNIQNSNSTNQTSTTRASSPAPEPPNSTSSVTIDLPTFESFDTEDIFLNPDPFADSSSILEQNMADLEDFGEAPINTYALDAIPLKNEPPPMFEDLIRLPFEPNFFQQHVLDQELNDHEELEEPSSSHHECCQSCDARSKQSAVKVKEEPLGEEHEPKAEGTKAATPNNTNNTNVVVKQEPKEEFFQIKKEELDLDDSQEQEAEVPAPVTAELTQEPRRVQNINTIRVIIVIISIKAVIKRARTPACLPAIRIENLSLSRANFSTSTLHCTALLCGARIGFFVESEPEIYGAYQSQSRARGTSADAEAQQAAAAAMQKCTQYNTLTLAEGGRANKTLGRASNTTTAYFACRGALSTRHARAAHQLSSARPKGSLN
ncbi:hypothetical protein RP20_CCG026955 [Aedes albopictus]|nr:hypothetical protein RP20_CCG026955 [Aedes albopictus]